MALPQGKSTLFNPGSGTREAAAYTHLSCCRTISFINQTILNYWVAFIGNLSLDSCTGHKKVNMAEKH